MSSFKWHSLEWRLYLLARIVYRDGTHGEARGLGNWTGVALIGNNHAMNWLDNVKFDAQGLIPVIAQEVGTNDVLMFAWMNREALAQTEKLGRAVYFSRSRGRLWPKGEASGNVQTVHEIRMDCDNDVLLLKVSQPLHERECEHADGHARAQEQPNVHAPDHVGVPAAAPGALPAQSIACHTGRHSCFFSLLDNGAWRIDAPVLKDPQTIYK